MKMLQRRSDFAQLLVALVTLLVSCLLVRATAAAPNSLNTTTQQTVETNSTNTTTNYNCPEDCHCILARNTHTPFLHAKCNSLNGLKLIEELKTTLPIHSIDLSYLQLTRLAHALDKLHDVTSIDLSHNELHEFGHLGRRIKKLNLKHNRITSAKLSKLPQYVQVLNLQHNDITNLPVEMKKLTNLQTLELSHNEINCSCETLDVRNWLQERHVFMEHPVKCSYPVEYKGKSWLQIKQEEVCEKEKRGWYPDEEENELMLGDQPVEGSGDEDEDEFGKAYIPIDKKATKSNEVELSEVEGSGDLGAVNVALGHYTTQGPDNLMARFSEDRSTAMQNEQEAQVEDEEEPEEDGSGSGGGMLIIPHLAGDSGNVDDFDSDSDKHRNESDSKPIEEVFETAQNVFNRHMNMFGITRNPSTEDNDDGGMTSEAPENETAQDVFNRHMGIFEGAEAETDKSEQTKPLGGGSFDDDVWPIVYHGDSEAVDGFTTEGILGADKEQIQQAKVGDQDDTNATYFLLGVIAIVVVGLLLYVGIKRCKNSSQNAHDAENQRQTELLDMDKKNLGKPLRNGNEHLPLIGEKSKADLAKPVNGSGKKPYDANDVKDGPTQQEPLINGNGTKNGNAPNEAVNNIPKINEPQNEPQSHEYYPITPRYPTPQSPRASKYAQYPQSEQNNNNPDETYLPSSPKSGRYSPVYSPETGRVKIKLTETPRPKTPMLVTRSKSNAGEMITTPVRAEILNTTPNGANGQLVH